MKMNRRAAILVLLIAFASSACSGKLEETTAGTVTVALTDSPSYAFDNVWVTVRAVWFHKVGSAPFDNTATGWVRFTLANGMTVNLAALSGDNNVVTVFNSLSLGTGTYQQMLLFLEPTENALTPSAADAGLHFNNQVDNGALHAALRVPNAAQGIRVADRSIQVDNGALVRLAIDFNVGRDVLPFDRGTVQEFLLQPRPVSFDLGNAGAIVGFIDNTAAADNAAFFEVLAQQVDTTLGARVVRRAAAVDNATGKFVLYPLVPTTTTTPRYDVVIRGIGRRTAIVTSIPVTAGTTPVSGATLLGSSASPITMDNAILPDFRIAATISATSGALANFYQDVSGTGFVIRQANFHPLTGTISNFALAGDQVGVRGFVSSGAAITLVPTTPDGGLGTYRLIAEAPLFNASDSPGGGAPVIPSSVFSPVAITGLSPAAPAVSTNIGVAVGVPLTVVPMDNLVVFATFGGTILNAQSLGLVTGPTLPGSPLINAIFNLPGGTSTSQFALASYGVSAYGWRTSIDNVLRIGPVNLLAKPQTGDVSVAFTLQNAPGP